MPTQTNEVDAVAQATEPVTFDWGYGDPDLPAISSGNSASATFKTPAASPGVWFIGPTPAGGPFSAPVPTGTVSTAMLVNTRQFDTGHELVDGRHLAADGRSECGRLHADDARARASAGR